MVNLSSGGVTGRNQPGSAQQRECNGHQSSPFSYYCDKYLGITCAFSTILVAMDLWNWPPTQQQTARVLSLGAISAACVLLAKRKLFVISAQVGVVALRGAIGLVMRNHALGSLALAVGGGIGAYLLIKVGSRRYPNLPVPDRYTIIEMGLDVFVGLPLLYLVHRLRLLL